MAVFEPLGLVGQWDVIPLELWRGHVRVQTLPHGVSKGRGQSQGRGQVSAAGQRESLVPEAAFGEEVGVPAGLALSGIFSILLIVLPSEDPKILPDPACDGFPIV